jgi:hypothetical protein
MPDHAVRPLLGARGIEPASEGSTAPDAGTVAEAGAMPERPSETLTERGRGERANARDAKAEC